MVYILRISKAGYGSVEEVEKWDARKVLQCLAYEGFCDDYHNKFMELNK